ncbi:hypothetical protein TKK_0000587 [Trichogramma kaykai]
MQAAYNDHYGYGRSRSYQHICRDGGCYCGGGGGGGVNDATMHQHRYQQNQQHQQQVYGSSSSACSLGTAQGRYNYGNNGSRS